MSDEILKKEDILKRFLYDQGIDGVLLSRTSNFAWLTGGGENFVNQSLPNGVADILFLKDRKYIITSTIEQYRIIEEEACNQGFELVIYDWYEGKDRTLSQLTRGLRIASDTGYMGYENIYEQLKPLRYSLLPEELERFEIIGAFTAKCMNETILEIKPGQTEREIAALLAHKLLAGGYQVPVLLVAADERAYRYRHPLPTDKILNRYVLIAVGARRWGLTASMTRLVHFGPLTNELRQKIHAVTIIDANMINMTIPGTPVVDILKHAVATYAIQGYPDEWRLHHQGGATGYESREYLATTYIKERVMLNQAFAWNPSIAGVKSEDTIISSYNGIKCITEIERWPMIEVELNGKIIRRPDILVR